MMSPRFAVLLALGGLVAGVAPGAADPSAAPPAPDARVRAAVTRYADALQAGNCRHLERLLAPAAYETYRTLCEENAEYPQFLRDFYRGASFWISDVRSDVAGMRCTLHVHTADGATSEAHIQLERDGPRKWRIARVDS